MIEKEIAVNCSFVTHLNLTLKIRRKTTRCLNCDRTLGEIYNYCPHCGQENNDHRVSFGTFVKDFFSNYFSFDSRIGRSLKPLFTQPGFLTNRFNEGQRKEYVHPLRLYLVVSLVFFFFLSLSVSIQLANNPPKTSFGISASDSTKKDTVESILADRSLTTEQVVDSLKKMGEEDLPENWFEQRLFNAGRRVESDGPQWFLGTFIQNMPIALLLAMPVLALLLKVAYRRLYYVSHLVHVLHIHSVALLLFSVLVIVDLLLSATEDSSSEGAVAIGDDWLDVVGIILLLVYSFLSFLRVYRQRWWITLLKFTGLGLTYSFVLGLTIGVIAIIALLDFF